MLAHCSCRIWEDGIKILIVSWGFFLLIGMMKGLILTALLLVAIPCGKYWIELNDIKTLISFNMERESHIWFAVLGYEDLLMHMHHARPMLSSVENWYQSALVKRCSALDILYIFAKSNADSPSWNLQDFQWFVISLSQHYGKPPISWSAGDSLTTRNRIPMC